MLPLRDKRENIKNLLKKLHDITPMPLQNWPRYKKKRALQLFFIFTVAFAMFFSEFVLALASPNRTLQAYAYFLDNTGGNGVANALGKLTITERAHLIVKGTGHYTIKIKDSQGRVLLSKAGVFNKTGYAEVVFALSPSKFRVDESYYVYITAEDSPFPLLYKRAETKISFKVHKDYPVIGLGAVRDGNQTVITARILTGVGPLRNKKIWFAYKRYNENETLKTLGYALSDDDGRAVFVTDALNDSRLYLIVAEFYGDGMYMPAAASQPYIPVITAEDYSIYDALIDVLNSTMENSHEPQNQVKKQASTNYGKIGRPVLSSMSYKTAMTAGERFRRVTASDRIRSNANSDYKFEFTEENLASLSLVEFLKRITTEDTPASALINIANILMNLDNVPFVLEQTQELLSKLQVPLIPDVAHSSLTEIRLYRTKTYIVNVEKTVAEKHVETYTVTKKVSKRVKYTQTITKKIKVRVQYIYYQKIVRKEMAFVRRPRPHWQIVYVVTYKPIIKWKYVWKTIKQTITRYKTITYTVTEKKTRTYYTHKTVTEKVKKEKREYFRILITEGFTVINEQTNEKMSLQQFFLFIMGFREDVLGQIINYLEAKIFGPALNLLQQFIDFLINVSKRFLLTLVKKLFEEIKSLVFQGLMLHMVKYPNNKNDNSEEGNMGKSGSKSAEYRDYLYMSSGKKYKLERANRPYNVWDSFRRLHARRKNDMAESTKLTITLSVLEAKAEYFITGEETAVVIPITSEALVYNMKQTQNGEPEVGWLDLNHYDHTIAKYGKFNVYDWREEEPTVAKKEMGYIPLGVTRTTYLILLPDATSADGRKIVVAYSIDVVDDNTKLVPDALKEFPELAKAQKIKTDKARRIDKSFYAEFRDIEEHILKVENIDTYGDLRNAVASRYEPNIHNLIETAVENSKVSGINVGEVESGGVKSQFFVINKDFTWTDSEGNEHTPIEINYSYFMMETGSDSKYKESSRVILGIMGKKDRKSMGPVEEQFADVHKGKAVAEKIFEKVCEIAKTNDIPANGVLRVISPSLLDKVDDIRIVGESDEFHNNANSITIVDPTLANPIAALYLDYFRAFSEHEYINARTNIDKTLNFKLAQIRMFRESIIDAYRIAILFHKDPEEIKFKFKYKDGERIESAEVSLAFLMKHESEFAIIRGSNAADVRSINIDGKNIKVDKIVEGFMHLRVKQDNANHKVILQPLDENLNPIDNEKVIFDFQEGFRGKKYRKRAVRHIVLSDDKNLAKIQKTALAMWSTESMLLVHGTLYACFKDMFHDSPELESRFIKLLGDAEHLGQNPAKSAAYLVFFLLQDTKGGGTAFVLTKRYVITLLQHERKLAKLKSDLDDLLNDPERLSKLTPEELQGLKETHKKIETELKNLRERIIVFLEEHLNSRNRAKKHKNKIVICMEVTKRYLERLLGGKEGIKRISKTVAIGTLVGLIFPRVVAETIMTLDISILEEILARDAKTFAALMSNKDLQLGIGLSLSAITFALLNLDIHRFVKMGTAETARAPAGANHKHKSSVIREFFGQLFDLKMILATFLSGFGMLLKAIADAPFYTTEEIAEEISKQVHEKLGETAGVIWDMTAGYRIPGLDMTGFEVALTVLLQGNGGVIQLITTAVTKAVEYMVSEVIKPLVEPVIAEYTYYIVDAIAA